MEYKLTVLEIFLLILNIVSISVIWSQMRIIKSLIEDKSSNKQNPRINDIRSL